MDKVSLSLKFQLENGKEGQITIKDVDPNASVENVQALIDGILTHDTQINGSKPVSFVNCIKSTTTEEIFI